MQQSGEEENTKPTSVRGSDVEERSWQAGAGNACHGTDVRVGEACIRIGCA